MKKTALLSTIGLCAVLAQAAPLTPGEALDRALGDVPQRVAGAGNVRFDLTLTRSYGDRDAVFVFTRGDGGFILASADDAAPALLGYGDTAVPADTAQMAPGFRYWLDFMASRVAAAADSAGRHRAVASARPQREPISPLCATRWNQSTPYNLACPELNGRRSVTGCVATAMSQAMKYHNWPPAGEGSHAYEWNGTPLSIDFQATSFKWDLMKNEYYYAGTPTEADLAVAELMKAAGYSVDMGYSPSASGALSINIAPALGEYFRYDKSMRYLMRDYYGLMEWENVIYNSLAADGPVIYDGQSYQGGHSFICDGYDRDGYFHFNWGWGGVSDGYFLLDALDPLEQGIGGADSGFNFMQDVIVGIRPDRTGTSEWNVVMVSDMGLSLVYNEAAGLLVTRDLIYNWGPGPFSAGEAGLRFQRLGMNGADEGEPIYYTYEIDEPINVRYGYRGLEFELDELPEGSYQVESIYRIGNGDWREVLMPTTGIRSYTLTKTADGIVLTADLPEIPVLDEGVFPTELYTNDNIVVTCRLTNNAASPFSNNVTALILNQDSDQIIAQGYDQPVNLEPGETIDYTYDMAWERPRNYRRGQYYIALAVTCGDQYLLLNEPQPIKCYDRPNAVEGVSADGDMTGESRDYYSVSGVRVATAEAGEARPELPAGLYMVRTATRAAKVIVK